MENFDVVICGGGAAGLTAGIYAARSGKRCVILDRGALSPQGRGRTVMRSGP